MINNQFYKRFFYYTLCCLPGLGFLIHRIRFTHFNVDEFQHTYLAWATTHFDMIQYRDFWDNHGILYTLFNSAILKIFEPEVGVPAIMLERYANLSLLIIGFYLLFEVFYELSSKLHYASLGVLFFSYGLISQKGIEVRPDNLQCIFLYSALLLLFKALKRRNNKLAFVAGLFITLMLMTNLKSISALMGIGFGLIVALACERSKSLMSLILWLGAGILSGLVVFALGFLSWGILDDYVNWNMIFNLGCTQFGMWAANKYALVKFFGDQNLLLSLACICSVIVFFISSLGDIKNKKYEKIILSSIIIYCIISRCIYVFWIQFDLIYFLIACYILSSILFSMIEIANSYLVKSLFWLLLLTVSLSISFIYYAKLLNDWNIRKTYFALVDLRFKDINKYIKPGEYTDYFLNKNCPGYGFTRNLSYLMQKFDQTIYLWEQIEGKEIYGKNYIEELNRKRVRLLIGTPVGVASTQHEITIKYIYTNYKYYNCIWERVTPFTN
jgi:hypothetical protein